MTACRDHYSITGVLSWRYFSTLEVLGKVPAGGTSSFAAAHGILPALVDQLLRDSSVLDWPPGVPQPKKVKSPVLAQECTLRDHAHHPSQQSYCSSKTFQFLCRFIHKSAPTSVIKFALAKCSELKEM